MADQNIKVNINLDLTEFNKNAKAMSDALTKVLGRDIKLFTDELGRAETGLKGTEQAIKGVGSATTKTGEGLKQSNKQWTNLSLVIQDLPFGFRGIQNNLPALAAGFASVTGPIYLAVSALIAIWTAFGDEITKVIFKTSEAASQNKLVSDSFKSVESSVVQASVSVDKMNFMIDQAKQGFVSKDKVVKTYNETLGKTIGQQSSFNGVVDAMQSKGEKYIELVTMMSFANALAAQSAKEAFTALMAEAKAPEEALGSIQKFGKGALSSVEYLINSIRGKTGELTPISDVLYGAVGTVEKGKEVQAATKNVTFIESFLKNVKSQISKFAKENQFNLFDLGGDDTKPKVSTKALDALKSQAKLYEDDLFTRRYYNLLVLDEEKRIALKQAEIDKLSKEELDSIAEDFKNRRLLIEKQTQDGIAQIRAKGVENQARFEKDELERAEKIQKELLDRSVYATEQRIKAVETEANASIKANRRNYQAQKQALEEAIVKLTVFRMAGIGGAEAMLKLDEAISNNKSKIEGLVDPLETLNQTLQNTFNQLNIDMLTTFGEQLGELMSGKEFDFTKLAVILADALTSIGKALVAYAITNGAVAELFKNPGTWPAALVAGIAAIAAGTALKSKLSSQKATAFANGGIVSGPTMGLVGEYPGAANNPEVIAPLDKLKSMIGGGGSGTFVLRGQDLLLSVNRAQKASNLKGQNISLA